MRHQFCWTSSHICEGQKISWRASQPRDQTSMSSDVWFTRHFCPIQHRKGLTTCRHPPKNNRQPGRKFSTRGSLFGGTKQRQSSSMDSPSLELPAPLASPDRPSIPTGPRPRTTSPTSCPTSSSLTPRTTHRSSPTSREALTRDQRPRTSHKQSLQVVGLTSK